MFKKPKFISITYQEVLEAVEVVEVVAEAVEVEMILVLWV
jgi:hypothetical protein